MRDRAASPPVAPAGVRYVITLDADTRLPRDAVQAACRQDGASAQPPALRRRQPAGWSRATRYCSRGSRRLCRSAARARCSSASSPARAASIPMPPPSPTCTRTCSAKAPMPARASMMSTPSRPRSPAGSRRTPAQPRSVRGNFRARGPGLRYRGRRGVSVALRRRRGAPASLGARRLAVAALDLRPRRCASRRGRHQPSSADRPLEDARQSAPDAVGAGQHSGPVGGWTLPFARRAVWTGFILATHRRAAPAARVAGIVPRRAGSRRGSHLRALGAICGSRCRRSRLLVTFLAHQAWLMADAIVRTLFRLFVSHRRLLEWVTAAQAQGQPAARSPRLLSADGRRRRRSR